MSRLAPYRKAAVALAGPLIVALASWLTTGTFDATEIALVVTGLLGGPAVYAAPNASPEDQLGWSVVDGEPVPD